MSEPAPVMVERKARIFRFGNYPAKRWGITREEFVAANGETGTIPIGFDPINRGHYVGKSSALDGKTGMATFSVVGDEVLADISWPPMVDEAARDHDLKFSGVFHPTDKTLTKIDLVERPHIPDAVLFAEENGEVLVSEDDEPEPPVEFCDAGDVRMFAQEMHDLAAHHHAGLCDPAVPLDDPAEADHHVRLLHDYAVREGGAYCPGMDHDAKEITMSDERIEELEAEVERLTAELAERPEKPVEFAESAREKALRERTERLEAQLVEKDAVAFADEVIRGGDPRAVPAEKTWILEQYRRAAADDARLPEPITFSEGAARVEGSRVDAFKAGFKLRPKVAVRDAKAVVFELGEEPPTHKDAEAAELDAIDKSTREFAAGLNGKRK